MLRHAESVSLCAETVCPWSNIGSCSLYDGEREGYLWVLAILISDFPATHSSPLAAHWSILCEVGTHGPRSCAHCMHIDQRGIGGGGGELTCDAKAGGHQLHILSSTSNRAYFLPLWHELTLAVRGTSHAHRDDVRHLAKKRDRARLVGDRDSNCCQHGSITLIILYLIPGQQHFRPFKIRSRRVINL